MKYSWSSFQWKVCLVFLMAVAWRNTSFNKEQYLRKLSNSSAQTRQPDDKHHAFSLFSALDLEDSRLFLDETTKEDAEEDEETSKATSSCYFQRGHGHFIEEEWKWIPQNCSEQYHDFIELIQNEQTTAATLHNTTTSAKNDEPNKTHLPERTQNLSIIQIADSLTYFQTLWLCDTLGYEQLPQLYNLVKEDDKKEHEEEENEMVDQSEKEEDQKTEKGGMKKEETTNKLETGLHENGTTPLLDNKSVNAKVALNTGGLRYQNINICTNRHHSSLQGQHQAVMESGPPFLGLASFRIYGMDKPCMAHIAGKADSRIRATESERLQEIFQAEILDRLPTTDTETVVILHSTLWDLSKGCNDLRVLDYNYALDFIQGMQNMEAVVRKLLPRAKIYWRSGAPVTSVLDKSSFKGNRGRNRYAQQTLHSIIEKHAGSDHYLDWWQQVKSIADNNETKYTKLFTNDGIHPKKPLTDAFFNLIMNTIVDQHPTMWSMPSSKTTQELV